MSACKALRIGTARLFICAAGVAAAAVGVAHGFTYGIYLAPPSNMRAQAAGCGVQLSWSDNTSAESGYELQERRPGGSFQRVLLLPANATQAALGSITPAVWCEYRVRAFRNSSSGVQYSAFSNVAARYRGCPG